MFNVNVNVNIMSSALSVREDDLLRVISEHVANISRITDDNLDAISQSRNLKTEIATKLRCNCVILKAEATNLSEAASKIVQNLRDERAKATSAQPEPLQDSLQSSIDKITKLFQNAIEKDAEGVPSTSFDAAKHVGKKPATTNSTSNKRPTFAEITAAPVKNLKKAAKPANTNKTNKTNSYKRDDFPELGHARKQMPARSGANAPKKQTHSKNGIVLRSIVPDEDSLEVLKKNINPAEDGISITFAKKLAGNRVFVACADESCVMNLQGKIREKLEPVTKKVMNPQVIIHNIPAKSSGESVTAAIKRATGETPLFPVAIRKYRTKEDVVLAVATLTSVAWNKILEHGKIFVDWTVCPVKNNVPVVRCSKCYAYGHTTRYCKNEPVEVPKDTCLNCTRENDAKKGIPKYRPIATQHSTFDKACPMFCRHVLANSRKINYENDDGDQNE